MRPWLWLIVHRVIQISGDPASIITL